MSTTHYKGKPFDDDNATGLSGGVNQKDALKNVTSTSNNPVNTDSLSGQASHDREKGMGSTAFSHKQSADAHPDTRQEKGPGGHREALGSRGPNEEVADSKFVESLNEAGKRQQQKGSTAI
ncbi:hypothetical protein GLOTRDRAFT_141085 [Gloeophyllum trabeum ATCC 11539]|uniref:Uncharacterized protein n=1 Tax=Gloeophyllum trabeum (strain ATCC 11539 / FP-39264 / Madison 617) TaxID=670483 RepID=S7PUZ6_GLOTA|nr:uncharacterized protein GLOTRDRAFT_141085 [Gloeophyllum trabeum ATCC 11539]EPQ51273.1 hypothetical protein GLOTRDRAFT_141085 [Gloeophyllum trabeum ATCC 11539]